MPTLTAPTLVDPATGEVLGATQLNGYVRYVEYLHGIITGGYSPFNGVYGKNDNNGSEWGRWYFTYNGQKAVYNDFTGTSSNVYVQNDTGEQNFTPAYANPLALTGAYTVGSRYYIRLVAAVSQTTGVNYIYVPQTQTYTYATPTTFTDAVVSAATDYSNLSNDLAYLNTIVQVPRAGIKGVTCVLPGGSTNVVLWNGSFIYLGLNSLNIVSGVTVPNGTTTLTVHIVDIGGSNDRTVATYSSTLAGNFTTPIDISALSPLLTVGTRYRLYINGASDSTPTVSVTRLHFTGSKNLSPMPPRWIVGQTPYGSTHDPRLQYTSNAIALLKTLAIFQTISAVDYGVQYPGIDNSAPTTVAGVTLPTFVDFRITRRWRFLHYLPVTTNQSGSLTYATTGENVSLPDNNADGTWSSFDLDSLPLLPAGYTYRVTGIASCYESPSSSY